MADDPLIGKVIAGHRLVELIGQGGQSVVYVAEHLRLGRKRAIKLLPARFAQDEEARGRFEEEWKAAAAIEHPGIVEVFDAGEVEGELYIVMQYVPGSDLGGLVAKEGPLAPERALGILDQVAQALDAAHAAGLVHRDVKPANILVGEGHRAWLSDFGVAKLAKSADAGRTRAGYFIGTADYAAPEQIEDGDVDGRADVYSLGCVLYYCLSGGTPFPRESETQVMLAQLHDPPPRLTENRPDLPPALDSFFGKALAKDRDGRYGTCRELVAAAREAAAQLVPAAPPRPASPPTVAVPRPRSGDTAPAGGIPVPVAAPPQPPPAPVAPQPPAAPPPRRRRVGLTAIGGALAGFAVLVGIGLVIWFVALKPQARAASPPGKPRPPAGDRTFELQVCRDFTAQICAEPGLTRSETETGFVVVETVTNVRAGDAAHFVLKDPGTGVTLFDSDEIQASSDSAKTYFWQPVENGGVPLGARRIEIDVYFNGTLLTPSFTVVFQ